MGWIIFLLSILPGFYSSTTAREIIGFDGGSIYIPCKYDLKYKAHVKYWCRGGQLDSCKILQRSNTTVGESENIIISDKPRGVFIVTMKKLKKADSSGYCCAIEIHGAQDEGICLHLSITDGFYSSTTAREIIGFDGGSIYIPCKYDLKYKAHVKYWCRGGQLDSCKILQRSNTTVGESENIIISDKPRGVFIVTMKKLKKADSSGYCCAIEIHGAQDEGICLHLSITDDFRLTPRTPRYSTQPLIYPRSRRYQSVAANRYSITLLI
ncbi:UNVERIFIED_CONTAM: hypothetical protein FKN15_071428 [Acipenser sinensis]